MLLNTKHKTSKIDCNNILKRGVNQYMDNIIDTYEKLDDNSKQIIDTLLKRHYTN